MENINDNNTDTKNIIEQLPTVTSTDKSFNLPTIKHIVMSGGGIAGFSFYGTLKESSKQGLWNIDNIKTIYGTSIGALFGIIISFKYDWETLDDFLIKRPWQNVYNINIQNMLSSFYTRGIFTVKVLEDTLSPLFKGKDLSVDITMKEFYEIVNIELHFFAVNVNIFDIIDFSYKTHPEWRVIDALYCSCCLPVLFQPIIRDDVCYSDGGILINYPVKYCIQNGASPDEIFGICRKPIIQLNVNINSESSLFDYIFNIFYKSTEKVLNTRELFEIKNEIYIDCPPLSISDILKTSSSMDERIRLIQFGIDSWNKRTI